MKLSKKEQARLKEINAELQTIEQSTFDPHNHELAKRRDALIREQWQLNPEAAHNVLGLV